MPAPRLPDPPFSLKDLIQPVPSAGAAATNTPEEIGAMRDRAAQDLTDIQMLRKCDEFTRFFLRRVRQKRDAALGQLITDKCDAMGREGHRQKVLALEEVLTLLEDDDKAARNLLAAGR